MSAVVNVNIQGKQGVIVDFSILWPKFQQSGHGSKASDGSFEGWLQDGDLQKRPSDLRHVKSPDDLIVMLSFLSMAESSVKACARSSTAQPAPAALLRATLFALFATL